MTQQAQAAGLTVMAVKAARYGFVATRAAASPNHAIVLTISLQYVTGQVCDLTEKHE